MRRAGLFAIATLSACGLFDPDPLPPRGEVLVVVDTDLPVPSIASRLRIDMYSADGTWFAHRDDVRPDPRDWPVSFSVFNDDEARERVVRIRLRAYLDARTVTYRGAETLEGAATPELEPDPRLSVDRTIELRLVFGQRGRARVLLSGECIGLTPCPSDATVTVEPTMDRDVPSVVGTFGAERCTTEASREDRVCIPGGTFLRGDAFYRPAQSSPDEAVAPERVLRVSRFEIDRDEVSVARFRAAIGAGFAPPVPPKALEVDGPPGDDAEKACTWSASRRGRESYPLNCVSWDTASAFCRFAGGELPTEAQFEWAALAAGRTRKTIYTWGDEEPTCARAIYGRAPARSECTALGEGVAPLDAPADTTPLGVRNLAGGLEELLRDHLRAYSDPCWSDAPSLDPVCLVDDVPDELGHRPSRATRGGSWFADGNDLRGVARGFGVSPVLQNTILGFRCVYPAR